MGNFFKKIGDFFLDKSNNGDEKRLLGVAFLGAGLVYALGVFGKPDNGILITVLTTGTGLLGLAVVGDKTGPSA